MIGIDTNVLVRFITQDNRLQSSQANKLIENQLTSENCGLISKIVLCELGWVLSNAYAYSRKQIADVIHQILITQEFIIEDAETALQALQHYRNGKAGFADYFLAQTHHAMGAEYTVTFDKKALQDKLFRKL
ncbi:MAG TPA: PIN domain-containing protein [Chromatiales bacterium]|nr:PIN domain-containing protein [Thiotrichales bacterium]HIP69566.1 PIN domain-containing protein [Chromatiales bacterium]